MGVIRCVPFSVVLNEVRNPNENGQRKQRREYLELNVIKLLKKKL